MVRLAGRDGELNRQRDYEWESEREIEKRIRNRCVETGDEGARFNLGIKGKERRRVRI